MSRICRCRAHNGHQKYRYKSEDHAQQVADERGWRVDIYQCPNRPHTFHITHAKQQEQNAS